LDKEAIKKLGINLVNAAPREILFKADNDWFEAFWSRKLSLDCEKQEITSD
jgi:hypothetical protein